MEEQQWPVQGLDKSGNSRYTCWQAIDCY